MAYRLGFGELIYPGDEKLGDEKHHPHPHGRADVEYARVAFMTTAAELHEDLVPALKALVEKLTAPPEYGCFPYLDPADSAVLEKFARRWNLLYRRAVPDWVPELFYESLAYWLHHPDHDWLWSFSITSVGGYVPDRPVGQGFDPEFETLANAKKRNPRKEHSQLSKTVEAWMEKKFGGYVKAPRRSQPVFFKWAVRRRIDRWSYERIAEEYVLIDAKDKFRNPTKITFGNQSGRICHEATTILRIIGLEDEPGRPRKNSPAR